ncbi:MAG: Ig-like domain-containing protein [Paraglaciecola sp.]|uniref:beta strand repeat-containing protein n=1 Tax=Paraglaciecola sp. TaxID=1920173 RepID=UPI003297A667
MFYSFFSYFFAILLLSACGGGGGDGGSNPVTAPISLNSISTTAIESSLTVSETFQLTTTGDYSNGSSRNLTSLVTWSVADSSILEISNSGLITTLSAGTTSITVTYEDQSNEITVTVKALTELVISPLVSTLAISESQQLNVTGQFTDNSSEELNASVTWESSDPSIADISSSGALLAVSEGTISITASLQGVSASIQITIQRELGALSITPVNSPLKISETIQLTAITTLSNGTTQDVTTLVTWSVANSDVLEVSGTGLITAFSAGNASVTATYEGISIQQSISVKALRALEISPTSITLAIASSQQLSLTGIYTDNSHETLNDLVTWSSSNSSIASVTSSGEVLAKTPGVVSISAKIEEISASLDVNISSATLQSIVISSSTSQIAAGLTSTLSAKGIYTDGSEQDLSNQVIWSVSDASIASIDSETGLLTALQSGSVSAIASKQGITSSLPFSVSAATLTSLAITPSVVSLVKGTSETVSVTATFSDKTKLEVGSQVEWTSSNTKIAEIARSSSTVSALMQGSTKLTAHLADKQADLSINVTSAELISIAVSPVNSSLPLGQSRQFTAHGTFADGTVQDLTSEVTWLSSDKDTAQVSNSVSSSGNADSIGLGSTTITAIIGNTQQATLLTVSDAVLSSIEILPANQEIAKGTSAQIKALGHYTDGSIIDLTSSVSWNSPHPNLVSLQSANSGTVLTQNEGAALVSAELEGVIGLGNIVVSSATLTSISIQAEQTIVPSGITQHLTAVATYSDLSTGDVSQQVSWISNDVVKATVSNNGAESGLVRAITPGQVVISANIGEITDQINIDVTDAVLTSIQVNIATPQVIVESSVVANAIGQFSDSSTLDVSTQVNWISSATNIASIGNTVTDKGKVNALSAGNVNISASLQGIDSPLVPLEVTLDPDLPKALNLSVQPNIILNDNNDTAQINLVLVPNAESGTIADGTPISLTITEGTTTREVMLVTTNGAANYSLSSSYDGFISLAANSSDFSVGSGLSSTDSLTDAFSVIGQGTVVYEDNTLKLGSIFYLYLRNLTNREFGIEQIDFGYLDPNNNNVFVHFPESPISSGPFVSNGDLTAGEFNYIGYELESDVEASIYVISYLFFDAQSNTSFRFDITFNFAQ